MNARHNFRVATARRPRVHGWRWEALRATLWVVPAAMVGLALVAFVVTYRVDVAVGSGRLALPGWAVAGQADAVRQILIGLSGAVITVAGVVFSITILALQLASQQFGPRMLRNFIRDLGTQLSLGAFVATFFYSVLTLGAVAHRSADFVPHVSVTMALALTLADVGVLIYFIHHVATSIQLTSVVAGIAHDFRSTMNDLQAEAVPAPSGIADAGPAMPEVLLRLEVGGTHISTHRSGFLQAVGHDRMVRIAAASDAVIRLVHRPGQFVVEGQPLALVWPAHAAADVTHALNRAHIVGSHRTLTQDPGFAVDQLAEVAIRALSPAVNDTFTALNCVDWLGDCLCWAAVLRLPDGIYRDATGTVRLIDPTITFDELLRKAFDKIRQSARGNPAVLIRQLETLHKVAAALGDSGGRVALVHQAQMIVQASEESVPEPADRQDVRSAYDAVMVPRRVDTADE